MEKKGEKEKKGKEKNGKREKGKKRKREKEKKGKIEKSEKGKKEKRGKGKREKREKEKKEKKTDSRNGLGRAPTHNKKILRRVSTQLYNLSICHQSIHLSYHLSFIHGAYSSLMILFNLGYPTKKIVPCSVFEMR